MTYKTCNKCGKKKQAREENFQRNASTGDGWRGTCKPCMGIQTGAQSPIALLNEKSARRRAEQLKQERDAALSELAAARDVHDLMSEVEQARGKVRGIEPKERKSGMREATVLVLASDWHLEERVRPEQVNGRNRYDLEISRGRATKFFESVRKNVEHQRDWHQIREMVLWIGGDIISNTLHLDQLQTNCLQPVKAFAYAQQVLADGIKFLLEDPKMERITIVCNDGNHGRLTAKQTVTARQENSLEWLLYACLAREFAGEDRLRWQIFESETEYLEIYGRLVRFTHGDAFGYGGGVGGITIPILKGLAQWDTVRQADLTVMGHWHQRLMLRRLTVNSSLIGFSPYSLRIKAPFEPPSQELIVLDSKGDWALRSSIALYVADRSDDAFQVRP